MSDIDTLLGLNAGPDTDMKALARNLRGERDMGRLFSLSTIPQVADLGGQYQKSATSAAKTGGTLSRARAAAAAKAEQDKSKAELAAEALQYDRRETTEQRDYDRAQLGEAAPFKHRLSGQTFMLQQADDGSYVTGSGDPVNISDFEPLGKGAAGGAGGIGGTGGAPAKIMKDVDQFGNNTLIIRDENGIRTVFADTQDPWDEAVAKDTGAARRARKTQQAGNDAWAASSSASRVKQLETVRKSRFDAFTEATNVQNAINALDDGAWTGPIVNKITPVLREATAKLVQAQSKIALTALGNYTFGSLSEAEAEWLKFTAINIDAGPRVIRATLVKRLKAMKLMDEANDYVQRELEANRTPDTNEALRIMKRDGFTFADPTNAEIDAEEAGTNIEAPEEFVNDPAMMKRWDALSVMQKRAYLSE